MHVYEVYFNSVFVNNLTLLMNFCKFIGFKL
jgi:hypothetical protein